MASTSASGGELLGRLDDAIGRRRELRRLHGLAAGRGQCVERGGHLGGQGLAVDADAVEHGCGDVVARVAGVEQRAEHVQRLDLRLTGGGGPAYGAAERLVAAGRELKIHLGHPRGAFLAVLVRTAFVCGGNGAAGVRLSRVGSHSARWRGR